jgi:hypothetical protein
MRLWLLLTLASLAWGESLEETRARMRVAFEKLQQSEKRLDSYGHTRVNGRKEFHADGRLKSQSDWTVIREWRDGVWVNRTVARDGKPVAEEERLRDEEAARRRVEELRAMTPDERERIQLEERKKKQAELAWVREFPEALNYRLVGEETLAGRAALVLEASPRPGYQPKNMRGRIFEKICGKVWLDKEEGELVKTDAETFDAVTVALGLLGKVDKGTRFRMERRRLAPGLWAPELQVIRFGARLLLVKSFHNEITTRYADWRPGPDLGALAGVVRP